jgi:hypothetical protein
MGTGNFEGKISQGKMAPASINTMLVDCALSFASVVHAAKMRRDSFSSHVLLVVVLVDVMLSPYFLSLLLSRTGCRHRAIRGFPAAISAPAVAQATLARQHDTHSDTQHEGKTQS